MAKNVFNHFQAKKYFGTAFSLYNIQSSWLKIKYTVYRDIIIKIWSNLWFGHKWSKHVSTLKKWSFGSICYCERSNNNSVLHFLSTHGQMSWWPFLGRFWTTKIFSTNVHLYLMKIFPQYEKLWRCDTTFSWSYVKNDQNGKKIPYFFLSIFGPNII